MPGSAGHAAPHRLAQRLPATAACAGRAPLFVRGTPPGGAGRAGWAARPPRRVRPPPAGLEGGLHVGRCTGPGQATGGSSGRSEGATALPRFCSPPHPRRHTRRPFPVRAPPCSLAFPRGPRNRAVGAPWSVAGPERRHARRITRPSDRTFFPVVQKSTDASGWPCSHLLPWVIVGEVQGELGRLWASLVWKCCFTCAAAAAAT